MPGLCANQKKAPTDHWGLFIKFINMLNTERIKQIHNSFDAAYFRQLKKDWYVMKVIPDVDGEGTTASSFPFGGTLKECHAYIEKESKKHHNQHLKPGLLTWVTSEWVEEFLFGTVNYSM